MEVCTIVLTFKKGIHPPHGKHFTEHQNIEQLLPKGDLVFPMSQHIGAPCEPLVKKGDRVLVGQKDREGPRDSYPHPSTAVYQEL